MFSVNCCPCVSTKQNVFFYNFLQCVFVTMVKFEIMSENENAEFEKKRMNYIIDSIWVVNHHPFHYFLCSLKMSCKSISPLFYPRHRDSCRVTAPNRESIGATRRAHWSQRATWYLLQLNLGLPIKTTKNARLGTWHVVKIVLTPTWPLLALWPPAPIVRWKPNENMSEPSPPSLYLHYYFAAALTTYH